MDRLALVDQLRQSVLFRRLPLGDLDRVASQGRLLRFAAGQQMLKEAASAGDLFLILQGSVVIRKKLGGEEERVIALRREGEWVGEMSLLDDLPTSASVTAQDGVEALAIPRQTFLEAVTADADATLDLVRTITARLRESDAQLIDALRKKNETLVARNHSLTRENRRLHEALHESFGFENFVGRSAAARRMREAGRRAAESDLPVLLLGETGTGKELVARSIHEASERSSHGFVAVNCAMLTETLLESELFGYARGAFTGATASKQGLVEAADGGTLFLDELADMPKPLQGALLRFLELGEFRRLGETTPRSAQVRVIAATHRDLDDAVRTGAFRSDLYYRLDVIRLPIPPLRERSEDLPELVAHLVARAARRLDTEPLRLDSAALATLQCYAFPGNVRELLNEIERLFAMVGPSTLVTPEQLSPRILEAARVSASEAGAPGAEPAGAPALAAAGDPALPSSGVPYSEAVRRYKARLIGSALEAANGNRARAAKLLGVHRSNLVRMIRDLGLEADEEPLSA